VSSFDVVVLFTYCMNAMKTENIRNFSIIAHIDHGKSTLADRMMEHTHSVEGRHMREQMLDTMELERERGITIKMQPTRMLYTCEDEANSLHETEYILNLIDTPGHIDFSYEVSRALKAVEGAILLVDATQGVQAQTLTTLETARNLGVTIIPAVSKVDAPHARVDEIILELSELLGCSTDEVQKTSGKSGEGIAELLDTIVRRVPAPQKHQETDSCKALVFDFEYSNHQGVIVYIRVFNGSIQEKQRLQLHVAGSSFTANEVGVFAPQLRSTGMLQEGEIGYVVTGIKEPGVASVGDTVTSDTGMSDPLDGYKSPAPVVWASVFPESQDDFIYLRRALERLRLEDSSLSFEEESSGVLGRGFRCGFLGMLHLEIIAERLRREFNISLVVTSPSTTYEIVHLDDTHEIIYTPSEFPDERTIKMIKEPMVHLTVITPPDYIGSITQVLYEYEGEIGDSETFGDNRTSMQVIMPLRELMRGFFDAIKSATAGYASLTYELGEMREADVVRLDVLVADEVIPAFSRIVSRQKVQREAEALVERLHEHLPRQMFTAKIQARAVGRILSSKTLPALKKDVTAKLYGGDITRKMKLREKQKQGKKKMQSKGKVHIPQDVFMKMMTESNE